MYKHKYYKYKNKWNDLKKQKKNLQIGGDNNDPDIVHYDDFEVDAHPEDDLPEDLLFDEVDDEIINNIFQPYKGSFEGFENPGYDVLTDNTTRVRVIFGEKYDVKGRIFSEIDFDPSDFVLLNSIPNKGKILKIENANDFDNFTDRYGELNDETIYINWEKVQKNYKGFYMMSSALGTRESDIPYKNITVTNWIPDEFNYIDDVIIFDKKRNFIDSRDISKPFKGKVVDHYAIEENEFVNIHENTSNNKIVMLDDLESFDIFTNKYGVLLQTSKLPSIAIDWDRVNRDYDGFYIPSDNDYIDDRFETAFFKDKKYNSWLKINDIEEGLVYIFE